MTAFLSSLALAAALSAPPAASASAAAADGRRLAVDTLEAHIAAHDIDWEGDAACVLDLTGPSMGVVNETACPTAGAAPGDCAWCDMSLIGVGICVDANLRNMTGEEMWDALCGGGGGGGGGEDGAAPMVPADDAPGGESRTFGATFRGILPRSATF